jgi:short-subunit dehydrogenase
MAKKVILITGASSGIGRASALAFVQRGDDVIALARRVERLAELEAEIAALPQPHGALLALEGDVRDPAALEAAVAAGVARFGRLDVLVANAGLGHRGSLVDASWDDLNTLLRTNIDGVLHSIRAAVPAMRQNGGGHIILISSVAANLVAPYMALYAASKTFVSNLAASLRIELENDHITFSDMRIGRTQTEFNEKRLGAAGRSGGVGPSSMPVERVAQAIVEAADSHKPVVVLRLIDRLILLGSQFFPGIIAWFVKRQYK